MASLKFVTKSLYIAIPCLTWQSARRKSPWFKAFSVKQIVYVKQKCYKGAIYYTMYNAKFTRKIYVWDCLEIQLFDILSAKDMALHIKNGGIQMKTKLNLLLALTFMMILMPITLAANGEIYQDTQPSVRVDIWTLRSHTRIRSDNSIRFTAPLPPSVGEFSSNVDFRAEILDDNLRDLDYTLWFTGDNIINSEYIQWSMEGNTYSDILEVSILDCGMQTSAIFHAGECEVYRVVTITGTYVNDPSIYSSATVVIDPYISAVIVGEPNGSLRTNTPGEVVIPIVTRNMPDGIYNAYLYHFSNRISVEGWQDFEDGVPNGNLEVNDGFAEITIIYDGTGLTFFPSLGLILVIESEYLQTDHFVINLDVYVPEYQIFIHPNEAVRHPNYGSLTLEISTRVQGGSERAELFWYDEFTWTMSGYYEGDTLDIPDSGVLRGAVALLNINPYGQKRTIELTATSTVDTSVYNTALVIVDPNVVVEVYRVIMETSTDRVMPTSSALILASVLDQYGGELENEELNWEITYGTDNDELRIYPWGAILNIGESEEPGRQIVITATSASHSNIYEKTVFWVDATRPYRLFTFNIENNEILLSSCNPGSTTITLSSENIPDGIYDIVLHPLPTGIFVDNFDHVEYLGFAFGEIEVTNGIATIILEHEDTIVPGTWSLFVMIHISQNDIWVGVAVDTFSIVVEASYSGF